MSHSHFFISYGCNLGFKGTRQTPADYLMLHSVPCLDWELYPRLYASLKVGRVPVAVAPIWESSCTECAA